ncbi:ferrous iron transport protein A [Sinomonas susongensis]|uniref:putative acetyltransferase n=1 Tax=Sinomonas susongensis TaxID=1324851 RepID=UPI001109E256|nr:ferrous iron transport protein A [Sinomonas susongensis]
MPSSPAPGARRPADVLRSLPLGTRVVVRYRIEGGFTDALGDLTGVGDAEAVISTRRGVAKVPLALVVAAKAVPPPPPPRTARRA